MSDYDFKPGDPGNTPNGAWVRAMMRKKGFTVNRVKLVKRLPQELVNSMFYRAMQDEFPEGL